MHHHPHDRWPADHPIWKIAQTVVTTVCVTAAFAVCLWITATNFDATEITALAGGGGLVAVASIVRKFLL